MERLTAALRYLNRHRSPYLFIAPFFISFAVFGLYPMLFSLYVSVVNYRFNAPSAWVGLQNFNDVLTDDQFWVSIKDTAILWLGSLPIQLVLGFVLASLLASVPGRLRTVLPGAYYMPVVTNLVAVAFVFQLLYDQKYGLLNYLLSLVGIPGVPWLTSDTWAPLATIILIVWQGTGYYVVFLLAGMQSIDRTLYEEASIDGAGAVQQAVYITLPLLRPVFLFLIVTGSITGLQIFTQPFLLFNQQSGGSGSATPIGGPGDSVLTISINIYQEGFQYLHFGYAAAASVLLGLLIACVSAVQFRLLSQRD
jgi:ABC-type sugar transport system permease subunit